MYKIAIVEDMQSEYNELLNAVKRYEREFDVSFECVRFETGEAMLNKFNASWDIIFLDIELSGMDGMSVARKVRAMDENVILIFVTKMKKFVINGYEVGALNYIVKPVNYSALLMTLSKAVKIISARKNDFLMVKNDNTINRVLLDDIYYIDIVNHYVEFHTKHGSIKVYGKLNDYEKHLNGKGFFRCISYAIVNVKYVDRIGKSEVVLTDGTAIGISRHRRTNFVNAVIDYAGENI